MATSANSLLAQFEDLSIDKNQDEEMHKEYMDSQVAFPNYKNLDHISKLQKNQHFHDTMKKVDDAMLSNPIGFFKGKDDLEYQLVIDCSILVVDIDNEINIIYNFIHGKYHNKFPELESLVLHPVDYFHIVKQIGNKMDLTSIDLKELLPSLTTMSIYISSSTTRRKPLSEEDLQKITNACDWVFAFDKAKKSMLGFLESRMKYIAPNLSILVGSIVAAKLIGLVGGLLAFTKIPPCNVKKLGVKKKSLAKSSTTQLIRRGFLFQSEIVQSVPPSIRMKACQAIANKCVLAARVDYGRKNLSTQIGETFRKEIEMKIEKWQEHLSLRPPKTFLIPNIDYKKKRSICRLKKMKEKYALIYGQKLENQMEIDMQEESSLGDDLGRGYRMLGQVGGGKVQLCMDKKKLTTKIAKKIEKQYNNICDA